MRTWNCAYCRFLNKGRKEQSNLTEHFRYGCDARGKDKYICRWIGKDSELKRQGCSDCNRLKFGDMFIFLDDNLRYPVYYLGKAKGKRLLFIQPLFKYLLANDDYLDGKEIRLCQRLGHIKRCENFRRKYDDKYRH